MCWRLNTTIHWDVRMRLLGSVLLSKHTSWKRPQKSEVQHIRTSRSHLDLHHAFHSLDLGLAERSSVLGTDIRPDCQVGRLICCLKHKHTSGTSQHASAPHAHTCMHTAVRCLVSSRTLGLWRSWESKQEHSDFKPTAQLPPPPSHSV